MFTKYRELEISTIPLYYQNKNPLIKEWSKYCYELAQEEDCEQWDKIFVKEKCGIGLALGRASQIIAVDIDTDEKTLKDLVPLSPVVKRGSKGETRFFKYNSEIKLSHYNSLDILTDGSQTVLPPSIHPETKKSYVWLTPDTLENFDKNDLPDLSLTWVKSYIQLADKLYPDKAKNIGSSGGRNNWLKSIVSAMRFNGDSEADILENIYNLDLHKNEIRLFTDETENFKAESEDEAKQNAWRFLTSTSATLIKSKVLPLPRVHHVDISLLLSEPKKFEYVKWPTPPHGLLKHLFEYISKKSVRYQNGLSLCGALGVGSVLISNIYKFDDIYSNIYLLGIAPTGAGKNNPITCAESLLKSDDSLKNLIGEYAFKSGAAIESGLDVKREKLDSLDECSDLFSAIKHGGVYQMQMIDILNKLYTSTGQSYKTSKGVIKDSIECFSPCVSMMMFTTQSAIDGIVDKKTLEKGLLPRCLIFNEPYGEQYDYETYLQRKSEADLMFDYITQEMINIRRKYKSDTTDKINHKPIAQSIEINSDAFKLLIELRSKFDPAKFDDELERSLASRAFVNIVKIAMISGALYNERISLQDVKFGLDIYESSLANLKPLAPEILSENANHKNSLRVLGLIKQLGQITKGELTRKTQYLKSYERDDILKNLLESGQVLKLVSKEADKPKTFYRINDNNLIN